MILSNCNTYRESKTCSIHSFLAFCCFSDISKFWKISLLELLCEEFEKFRKTHEGYNGKMFSREKTEAELFIQFWADKELLGQIMISEVILKSNL